MNIELWALLGAAIMAYFTLFLQLNYSAKVHGMTFSLSNRDAVMQETPLGGRLRRAALNNVEAIALFAPLVVVAQLTDVSNAWTQYASVAFLISRVLYLPSYALGMVPIRSIVWMLGFFALPFFLCGLLFLN